MAMLSFFILLIPFFLLIVIGAAIIISYRHKLNKALKSEESSAHISIPAPFDTIRAICVILVFVLLVWIGINLSKLAGIIDFNQQDTLLSTSNLEAQIGALSLEMENMKNTLTMQGSRILSIHYDLNKVDATENTAEITYHLQLKSFTDDTVVTLHAPFSDDVKLTSSKSGDFQGKATIHPFTEWGINPTISISEGSTHYTEEIPWDAFYLPHDLFVEFIPSLYVAEHHVDNNPKELNIESFVLEPFDRLDHMLSYDVTNAELLIMQGDQQIDSTKLSTEDFRSLPLLINVGKSYAHQEGKKIQVILKFATADGYEEKMTLLSADKNQLILYANSISIFDKNGKEIVTR